jgi:hypothetical protein
MPDGQAELRRAKRYRGLKKYTHCLLVTCSLANLFMARRPLVNGQNVSTTRPAATHADIPIQPQKARITPYSRR